ncbi:MAG: helix-turn-helix transcriptional regulator [Chloroflexota bacterium]|nr:helix-turn-helix transcriptional regulator [Caldilineaceae bacterium]MDE0455167.1 helix-turn-helix transcriptional regulator [Gammaproteobacteria bacterium]MDE2839864.1 helix-turn-helix transcriptional regulator [Chloroflexota bacterium]
MSDDIQTRHELGLRIRHVRLAKNLTIKELAQEVGMSAGYLSEVERGGSALSGEKLAAIASRLALSIDYFLTGVRVADQDHAETIIPAGLAQAAKSLNLTYVETSKLLAGKQSLVARRGPEDDEWTVDEWLQFYKKVKRYL